MALERVRQKEKRLTHVIEQKVRSQVSTAISPWPVTSWQAETRQSSVERQSGCREPDRETGAAETERG